MKRKNLIKRTGNFEITIDGGSEYKYLRIKSVSGHWGVTYRDDNEMYGKILAMARNLEYEETLERTIVYLFHCTTMPIDEQFALDFLAATQAMKDRLANLIPEPTEEEEDNALNEAEAILSANAILKGGK